MVWNSGNPAFQFLRRCNLLIGQRVLPRVDDAAQVNVGAEVTQDPLGLVWRRRASRSTELVYGVVNLRDDNVGIQRGWQ